jgi:hypothetical protein
MPDYSNMPTDPSAMMATMGPFLFVMLAIFVFMIYLQWRIFSKAGYPGAIALVWLTLFIPILNIIGCLAVLGIWIWFAFAEWPVQKQARGAAPAKA